MSCVDCEKFEKEGKVYYIRIETANIGIIACEKHFKICKEKLLK